VETYTDFESSNVASLGYDPEKREVHVQFKDKAGNHTAKWAYWPVDRADFDTIRTAPSVGRAVNQSLVRGGIYSSRKVE